MAFELFRADIHCHSTCSDGSDAPLDLLKKAKSARLQGLSVTDHDTMGAYTPEFLAQAEVLEIRILPGIEISTEIEQTAVHILGYGYDVHSSSLTEFLQEIQKRRGERNRSILKKLTEKKMPINEEELFSFAKQAGREKTIGRAHIAALMVKKGFVGSLQEAFDRYLKDNSPCYVSGFKFTPQDAIDQIHKAKGKAVLAHPHFYKKGSLLKKILAFPYDGIECYYAALSKQLEIPWLKLAKERGWIATGGSDYHGAFKPHISLGSSWVDESTFNALLSQ